MPPLMVLAIIAIAVAMALLAMNMDRLALFAPKGTAGIKGAAQSFCLDHCRTEDDECPLHLEPKDCPLWQLVNADLDTGKPVDIARAVEGIELASRR